MLDIEGKEINVGDECIFSSQGWYGITKIRISKFTAGRVFYNPYIATHNSYAANEYFINKSSEYCKFYKI